MSAPDTADEINNQAVIWAVRIDGTDLDPAVGANLEAWLAADPRRPGALLRAQAALSLLDRGRALRKLIPRPRGRMSMTRRRLLLAGASLGGLAAGLGGIAVLTAGPRRYSTHFGEVRRVSLPDGSIAAMDTQSVIDVTMVPAFRAVELTHGEVWFQVAKDRHRPFLVEAGRVRVRAVGTAFSVHRLQDGADVLVTEGAVETWVTGVESRKSRVIAGYKAFVADYEPPRIVKTAAATVERTLAWRNGEIALGGTTLADAVTQFNRYNSQKLVVADPELARLKLVGRFRMNEPREFARAVASILGASISETPTTILLSRVAGP